jgi:hypothetical protein
VRFGHDPGQEEKENKQDKGTNQNRVAFEQFNVFVVRPFNVHSSNLASLDSADSLKHLFLGRM